MTMSRKAAQTLSHIDHRSIGERQKLFFFHKVSKGSCFFQPRGAYIYNKLIDYLRQEYRKRNYEEVITPNIYDCRLWETSGHWSHYQEHMIKFKLGTLSSGQLPIRWADFGALHRNEFSGSLLGLSRVRRFQQDDAHIFCTPDQIEHEVKGCLDFANHIYQQFGFTFDLALALRPDKFMGDEGLWNRAENSLRQALAMSNLAFEEHKFEGAFYGPKIDLIIRDCHGRAQQCATIQLDFQLPQRFELVYKDEQSKTLEKPVIIHRAIFGSIERFIAVLAEHTGGRWPFWLSPLQAKLIPIHENFNSYASEVRQRLTDEGFEVDCDLSRDSKLSWKIREAQLDRYNFILVVGEKEQETNSVTVRLNVGSETHQVNCLQVNNLIQHFHRFVSDRVRETGRELLDANKHLAH